MNEQLEGDKTTNFIIQFINRLQVDITTLKKKCEGTIQLTYTSLKVLNSVTSEKISPCEMFRILKLRTIYEY